MKKLLQDLVNSVAVTQEQVIVQSQKKMRVQDPVQRQNVFEPPLEHCLSNSLHNLVLQSFLKVGSSNFASKRFPNLVSKTVCKLKAPGAPRPVLRLVSEPVQHARSVSASGPAPSSGPHRTLHAPIGLAAPTARSAGSRG